MATRPVMTLGSLLSQLQSDNAQHEGAAEMSLIKHSVSRKLAASARQRVAALEDHIESARISGKEWPIAWGAHGTAELTPSTMTTELRRRVKLRLLEHLAACTRLARAVLNAPNLQAAETLVRDDPVVGSYMRQSERKCGQPAHRYGHKIVLHALHHAATHALYTHVANLPPPDARFTPDSAQSEAPTDF